MSTFIRVCKVGNYFLFIMALAIFTLPFFLTSNSVSAQHHDKAAVQASTDSEKKNTGSAGIAFIAAAIATGLSSIAAGIAVSITGSAAIGAVAEKPEIMGKVLIFVALAEGIAIYGLLISIIIMTKI